MPLDPAANWLITLVVFEDVQGAGVAATGAFGASWLCISVTCSTGPFRRLDQVVLQLAR